MRIDDGWVELSEQALAVVPFEPHPVRRRGYDQWRGVVTRKQAVEWAVKKGLGSPA
jgi:hypothetical protein